MRGKEPSGSEGTLDRDNDISSNKESSAPSRRKRLEPTAIITSSSSRPGAYRVACTMGTTSMSRSTDDVDEEEAGADTVGEDQRQADDVVESLAAFTATTPAEAVPYECDGNDRKTFPSIAKHHLPHVVIETVLVVAVIVLSVLLLQSEVTEDAAKKRRVMISTNTSGASLCWSSQGKDDTRVRLARCNDQDERQVFLIAPVGEWLNKKAVDVGKPELAKQITIHPACGVENCDFLSIYAKGLESAFNRTFGYVQGELFTSYKFPHIFWELPLGNNLYALGGKGDTECTYDFDCFFATNYYTEPIVRQKEDRTLLTLRTKKSIEDAQKSGNSYIVPGIWRIISVSS